MTIRQTIEQQEHFHNRVRKVSKTLSTLSVDSQESCNSTLPVGITKELEHRPRVSPRRVGFCLHKNKVYKNTQIFEEDCGELWFSPDEMQDFKTTTALLSRKVLRSSNPKHQKWINELTMAYEGFTEVSSADDMQQILELSQHTPVLPTLTGLEKWTLRRIVQDKAVRRQSLMQFIRAASNDMTSSRSNKTKQIRKVSRDLSRPARLFAHHVALASLHSEC